MDEHCRKYKIWKEKGKANKITKHDNEFCFNINSNRYYSDAWYIDKNFFKSIEVNNKYNITVTNGK